jgi:UDP-N-acetyl-D-glucosamine dehydrogenase
MERAKLADLERYDCIVNVTDHSDYDYKKIVREGQLVVDTQTPQYDP